MFDTHECFDAIKKHLLLDPGHVGPPPSQAADHEQPRFYFRQATFWTIKCVLWQMKVGRRTNMVDAWPRTGTHQCERRVCRFVVFEYTG